MSDAGNAGRTGGLLAGLRRFTPARIGLGRAGPALPTREVLAFGLAHARARDAVHAALDVPRLLSDLAVAGATPGGGRRGPPPVVVRSAAADRATYLARPDLGRRLAPGEAERLAGASEVVVLIADGLSALAVQRHAAPLLASLRDCSAARWAAARVVIGLQGRVALGDEVAARLGARLVAVLIGERPGLTSPDSLGVYLTFDPRPGRTDAERNCVSNVRPEGLPYREAARRVDWLAAAALARGLTGVGLKDESDAALPAGGGAELP
ncbi:MAG TPA: ethanolamine ammonia-lyase subunit EutC [Anaeromyxobacteraceae bacterium]|nr:ethanolamine ammonia-lyase subunit EutC [Anaeromyxobacteraceae bacterium]